jgi:hypothetical protein
MNPLMYGDLIRRHTDDLRDHADRHRLARLYRPRPSHSLWTWTRRNTRLATPVARPRRPEAIPEGSRRTA